MEVKKEVDSFKDNCLFLLSSIEVYESIGFVKIFDFQFLIDLHILGCPGHNLFIPEMSVGLRDKKFVTSVARELTHRISRNFTCRVIQI